MKKDHHHPVNRSRYEVEEGFQDEQQQPAVILKDQPQLYIDIIQTKKNYSKSNRIKSPKIKLKHLKINQNYEKSIANSIADRQFSNRRSTYKSLELKNKSYKLNNTDEQYGSAQPLYKLGRIIVGENLLIPTYSLQDTKAIKSQIIKANQSIVFETPKQVNTHGFIRKIIYHSKMKGEQSFIQSKFNVLLKQRMKQSYIMPKTNKEPHLTDKPYINFCNSIQSANMEIAAKISQSQYDIYLRNDTNTHGHQNWFYFSITNNDSQKKTIKLNICNVKRDFRLINRGQKIFMRHKEIQSSSIGLNVDQLAQKLTPYSQWYTNGTNFSIKQNTNQKIARGKIYKLSFTIDLLPNKKYQISMLPSYTYSKVLSLLENIELKYPKYVQTELLCYSMMGLGIPLLNITNKQSGNSNKKVILISCRIHPGEAVASYVLEGLILKILSQAESNYNTLLCNTIFKIIPMINPDGVVYGNFRTNYLGIDMNRAFCSEDATINPQIVTLKKLGQKLRSDYGQRFIYFLDLHGHSSGKNIFTYGPDFDSNDSNYYNAKVLPRVLTHISKYFNYDECQFFLSEYKSNTARGYFLKQLKTMTYTVQSSYSMYDENQGSNNSPQKLFQVADWIKFGEDLVEALDLSFRLIGGNKFRSHRELKKMINEREQAQNQLINKIKSDFKKQQKKPKKQKIKIEGDESDSDGESDGQDLNEQERKQIVKKMHQSNIPSYILPKMAKPAIVYPTVTPKLFQINEEKQLDSFKYLFTKRNRYGNFKVINNINNLNQSYLPYIEGLQKLKPSIKRLDKKNGINTTRAQY